VFALGNSAGELVDLEDGQEVCGDPPSEFGEHNPKVQFLWYCGERIRGAR